MSKELKKTLATNDANSDKPIDQTATTDVLLTELIELIQRAREPKKKPDNKFNQLLAFSAGIKENWFWAPIIAFAIAWSCYQFNPLYVFEKFKIASDQVQLQLKQYQYQRHISDHYIQLGDQLLSDGKNKDAINAYQQAKNNDEFNLLAEYSLLRSQSLDFSANKQFDAVVVKKRLEALKKMIPAGLSGQQDSHILYAEAILDRKTGVNSKLIKSRLDALLVINPGHASALGLRADINRELGNYVPAIKDYQRAVKLSPYNWTYLNNLAYSYQLSGEQWYQNGQVKLGKKAIKQALDGYIKLSTLDNQVLAPRIEILRLKIIYGRLFSEVNAEITDFINSIYNDKLHKLAKNQGGLNYQWQNVGQDNAIHSHTLNTWLEKQTYLQQLQFLARVLEAIEQQQTGKDMNLSVQDLTKSLKILWSKSSEGKRHLPFMLVNDIQSLERYNANWLIKQITSQQVLIRLKKISSSMN